MPYLFYRKGLESSIPFHITDNLYIGRLTNNISKYDYNKNKRKIIESKFDIHDFRNNIILDNKKISGFHASIIQLPGNQYGLVDFNSKHHTNNNRVQVKPWEIKLLKDVDHFNILDWNFTFIKNELKGNDYTESDETETFIFDEPGDDEQLKKELLEMGIVIGSEKMYTLYETAKMASRSGLNVMIIGERGTGKELVARAMSQWAEKEKYFAVNTPTLNPQNLQSELFGHKKGAFTGAIKTRKGKFEEAANGMIFLDEIGDLDGDSQALLLRAVGKDKEISPLGSNTTIPINTIVISATNRDLEKIKFRKDLKDRLTQIILEIPPLRERKEDIKLLVEFFMKRYLSEYKKENTLSQSMIELFYDYDWPGNIRELESVIQNVLALSKKNNTTIFPENLINSMDIKKFWEHSKKNKNANRNLSRPITVVSMKDNKMILLFDALKRHKWNISAASDELKIERTGVYPSLKKVYGLKQPLNKNSSLKSSLKHSGWDIEMAFRYTLKKNNMDVEKSAKELYINNSSPLYELMERIVEKS